MYLSVDGGKKWTKVSGDKGATGATGSNGDSMFQSINTEDENKVIFTLTDNTTIEIPTWKWAQTIQTRLDNMNNDMATFRTLLAGKKYITAIESITDNGKTGQKISWTETDATGKTTNGTFTIWDGKDGAEGSAGHTPTISAREDKDGKWYWTVDGVWITVGTNNDKVCATGQDGSKGDAGKDAPTPKVQLGNTLKSGTKDGQGNTIISTAVYLSVDNGTTWWKISGDEGQNGSTGATGPTGPQGEKGDSFFQNVTATGDYLTLELTGGSSYQVPIYKAASLTLTAPASWPYAGNSMTVTCQITCPSGSTHTTDIFIPKGWKADPIDETHNTLVLYSPSSSDTDWAEYNGKLIVVLNVDNNQSIMRSLDIRTDNNYYLYVTAANGNLQEMLEGFTGNSLTVNGRMNSNDLNAIKNNTTITYLDMENVDMTELPREAFQNNTTLTSVKLPKGLKTIGGSYYAEYGAFRGCSNLSSITIPTSVTTIYDYAFYGCAKLEKIEIPEGITSTEKYTFEFCTNLKEVSLPSTFTKIDWHMFSECSALETITWPIAEGVNVSGITISSGAFNNASSNFKIKVPGSKLDAMKNKFSNLQNHFEAIETTP